MPFSAVLWHRKLSDQNTTGVWNVVDVEIVQLQDASSPTDEIPGTSLQVSAQVIPDIQFKLVHTELLVKHNHAVQIMLW